MLSNEIKYNKDKVGRVAFLQIPIEIWEDLIDNFDIPDTHKSTLDQIKKNIESGSEKIYSEKDVNLNTL